MAFLRSGISSEIAPTLYGKKVFLRTPQMTDFPAWSGLRGSSHGFLAPWEPKWNVDELTRSSFRRRVRHYQKEIRDDNGYAFFIFDLCDTKLLGGVTLNNVRRGVTQSCTIGYWIGEPYANHGYMSDALAAIIPFVFDTLGLHRLEAACLLTNTPSVRILEKAGFQQEGVARRYLRINDIWQDHLLYALLTDDPRR